MGLCSPAIPHADEEVFWARKGAEKAGSAEETVIKTADEMASPTAPLFMIPRVS